MSQVSGLMRCKRVTMDLHAQPTRCDGSGDGVRLDMFTRTTFPRVSRSASESSCPASSVVVLRLVR